MNKEQLHRHISESTGNESNICQIYAIKDNEVALDDCWHGFKTLDAMNVNWYVKGLAIDDDNIEIAIGIKAAENREHDGFYNVSIFVDFSTQEPRVSFDIVW